MLSAEYVYGKTKSYSYRDIDLESVRRAINNILIDNRFRSILDSAKVTAERGAAMQAASSEERHNCGEPDPPCKQLPHDPTAKASTTQRPRRKTDVRGRYCPHYQYKTHPDSACLEQKTLQHQAGTNNIGTIGDVH